MQVLLFWLPGNFEMPGGRGFRLRRGACPRQNARTGAKAPCAVRGPGFGRHLNDSDGTGLRVSGVFAADPLFAFETLRRPTLDADASFQGTRGAKFPLAARFAQGPVLRGRRRGASTTPICGWNSTPLQQPKPGDLEDSSAAPVPPPGSFCGSCLMNAFHGSMMVMAWMAGMERHLIGSGRLRIEWRGIAP